MNKFTRQCPVCKKTIKHKSERSCRQCDREDRMCRSCGAKARLDKYGYGENFTKHTIKGAYTGSNNPFYGKTHSEETKEKIRNRDKSFFKSKSYLKKMSLRSSGSNNGMYGRSVYQVWLSKYGENKANELMKNFREKQRINSSGENNPMYGKLSPQGSGNGWSGWYNDWFFRSLKELSYVVNVLEVNKNEWESAESLGIKIPYVNSDGRARNYIPDFLVDSNILVEIKPIRLKSSMSVRIKQEAAEEFVKQHGWKYQIIDPPPISNETILNLYKKNALKFIDRYEKLFKEKYID